MKDLVDFFKAFNFNPLALPSDGIKVLQMLLYNKETQALERLGINDYINKLFESDGQAIMPYAIPDLFVEGMKGTHTVAVNVKTSFFTNLLAKYKLGFNLNSNESEQVIFVFESPKMTALSSLDDLEEFLNKSQIKKNNNNVKRLLDNEIYIITAVLKVKNFAVTLVDKCKLKGNLQIPSIPDFLESDLLIDTQGNKRQYFHYKGDELIPIAVKAVKVQHDPTIWEYLLGKTGNFWIIQKSGHIVRGEDDIEVEYLI